MRRPKYYNFFVMPIFFFVAINFLHIFSAINDQYRVTISKNE